MTTSETDEPVRVPHRELRSFADLRDHYDKHFHIEGAYPQCFDMWNATTPRILCEWSGTNAYGQTTGDRFRAVALPVDRDRARRMDRGPGHVAVEVEVRDSMRERAWREAFSLSPETDADARMRSVLIGFGFHRAHATLEGVRADRHKAEAERLGALVGKLSARPDVREELSWFGQIMEYKLRQNDSKGAVSDINLGDIEFVVDKFNEERKEMEELLGQLNTLGGDTPEATLRKLIYECADVANMALIVASVSDKELRRRFPTADPPVP